MRLAAFLTGSEIVGADKEDALGIRRIGIDGDHGNARLNGGVDRALEQIRHRLTETRMPAGWRATAF